MNFLNNILAAISKYPDRNAFCIQDRFYSYSYVASKVAAIQNEDRFINEQRIGVIISDDIETYCSLVAILLAGKTYIPVHPAHPIERIRQIVGQSGMKLILLASDTSYDGIDTVNTSALFAKQNHSDFNIPDFHATDRNAYILFTSGSTGIPKGVPISYHNLDSFINAFFALGYKVNENDRFLQMFDLTFDLSIMSYLVPLCIGACVYTISDDGIKYANVYKTLESHNITFALMVPSILSYLRPYFSEIELPKMRYSLFCGEALYKDFVTEWMKCVPNAIVENVYGPTEATIFCLTYNINKASDTLSYNEIVCIGHPMDGMKAIVIDQQCQILSGSDKGELCLHGNQITPGYLDNEKSKAAFLMINEKRYYRTGDIAFKEENGNFMYCGRVDQQVKIQGYRIELSEIESHLRKITDSAGVVALALNTANGLTQIRVVFEDKMIDVEKVMGELRTKIPEYMMPSQIHFVAPFPLNANGKTDRKALTTIIS